VLFDDEVLVVEVEVDVVSVVFSELVLFALVLLLTVPVPAIVAVLSVVPLVLTPLVPLTLVVLLVVVGVKFVDDVVFIVPDVLFIVPALAMLVVDVVVSYVEFGVVELLVDCVLSAVPVSAGLLLLSVLSLDAVLVDATWSVLEVMDVFVVSSEVDAHAPRTRQRMERAMSDLVLMGVSFLLSPQPLFKSRT